MRSSRIPLRHACRGRRCPPADARGFARRQRSPGQVAELPADVVLLVDMYGAQLVELAHFGVDSDLLHDRGIARGDGLDFGVGKRPTFEVLGAAHRSVSGHHLLDEAGLRRRTSFW